MRPSTVITCGSPKVVPPPPPPGGGGGGGQFGPSHGGGGQFGPSHGGGGQFGPSHADTKTSSESTVGPLRAMTYVLPAATPVNVKVAPVPLTVAMAGSRGAYVVL